jgi:glycosyltransferase involved in cell wall biosynthesis
VFKWEPRKGWDVLLRAYSAAFQDNEPVSLYLLTHIWFPGGPETYGDKHNTTHIAEEIKKVLGVSTLAAMPHFCILCVDMAESDVARLYKSVDAFVLPTFGEGWGLGAIQAMSMGLPTITTAWGGQLEFLRPNNSFMIGIDGVEEIPADSVYRWRLGKKWAIPSLNETRRLMRLVYDDRKLSARVGAAARQHVVKYFSEEAVAELVRRRLDLIHDKVRKMYRDRIAKAF